MARRGFLEKSVDGLCALAERALLAEEIARREGFLQRLDPRAKLVGLLSLIIASAMAHSFASLGALFVLGLALALFSRVPLRELAFRVWPGAFFFSGAVGVPALFLTPGETIARVPLLQWEITQQGLRGGLFLLGRVECAVTFSALLVFCTPWTHVLKALRSLGAPAALIVILGMTHRYIWVLLATAREMFEARRARLVGELPLAEKRRVTIGAAGVLLGKTLALSEEIYLAMLARGFRGQARTLDEFAMRPRDWLALLAFTGAASASLFL
jgi:cobalt/nickel transport system permease protein